jgi:hypothetical protein
MTLPPGMSDAQMGEQLVREIGRQAAFDILVRLKDGQRDKVEVFILRDQHGVAEVIVDQPRKRSSPRRQRASENRLTQERKAS